MPGSKKSIASAGTHSIDASVPSYGDYIAQFDDVHPDETYVVDAADYVRFAFSQLLSHHLLSFFLIRNTMICPLPASRAYIF